MHLRVLSLLALFLLAGCAELEAIPTDEPRQEEMPDEQETVQEEPRPSDPAEPSEPAEPADPARPVAPIEEHGDVEETWGRIESGPSGTRWAATREVRLHNGAGDADLIDLGLDLRYADVEIVDEVTGGYTYDFLLRVEADTEAEARQGLEDVDLRHEDDLLLGTLTLRTDPTIERGTGSPLGVSIGPNGQTLSYELRIEVPWHLAYAFGIDATYTDVEVGTFWGPSLAINGDYCDIAFESAEFVDTSFELDYGTVRAALLDGQALDANLDYSDIIIDDARLWSIDLDMDYSEFIVAELVLDGDASFDASFSEIALDVLDDGGYDIQAEWSYGDADIDLPELEVLEEDDDMLHVRTIDFNARSVQAVITADLSYSEIVVD